MKYSISGRGSDGWWARLLVMITLMKVTGMLLSCRHNKPLHFTLPTTIHDYISLSSLGPPAKARLVGQYHPRLRHLWIGKPIYNYHKHCYYPLTMLYWRKDVHSMQGRVLLIHMIIGFVWEPDRAVSLDNLSGNTLGLKKKLFVSCYPTLTSFYSKKSLPLSFFCPPNSQSTLNMHKTHIFDQKNYAKNIFFTDLPILFFFGPLQETNNFFF